MGERWNIAVVEEAWKGISEYIYIYSESKGAANITKLFLSIYTTVPCLENI